MNFPRAPREHDRHSTESKEIRLQRVPHKHVSIGHLQPHNIGMTAVAVLDWGVERPFWPFFGGLKFFTKQSYT